MLCRRDVPVAIYSVDFLNLPWLFLAPASQVFCSLVRDDIQRMKRFHSICFCENALVCTIIDITGNRGISPGKCRCKLVFRAGARVCVVMSVLRRAEAG